MQLIGSDIVENQCLVQIDHPSTLQSHLYSSYTWIQSGWIQKPVFIVAKTHNKDSDYYIVDVQLESILKKSLFDFESSGWKLPFETQATNPQTGDHLSIFQKHIDGTYLGAGFRYGVKMKTGGFIFASMFGACLMNTIGEGWLIDLSGIKLKIVKE